MVPSWKLLISLAKFRQVWLREDGLTAFYYGNGRLGIGGKPSLVIPEGKTPRQAQSYELDIRDDERPNPRKSFRQILNIIPKIRPISSQYPQLHANVGLLSLELPGELQHVDSVTYTGSREERCAFQLLISFPLLLMSMMIVIAKNNSSANRGDGSNDK